MDSMINDILAKIEKEKKLERERKVVEEDLKENGDEEDLNSDQSTIDDQDPVVSLRSSSPGSSQPTRSGSSLYPKGFNNGNKKKKGRRNWNEIREEKEEGQEDQADRNCSPPHNVANFPPTPFPFYAMPPMMPVMPIPMSFLFQPMLPPQPSNSGGLVNNLNNYLSLFSPQLQNNQTGYNDKVVGAGGSSSVDEIAYKERRLVGKRRNDKAEEQEYDAYQKKKRQDIVKFNDRRKVEYKAAIVVQKYFRGYSIRKRYSDFKVNDIIKHVHPDKYYMELIIKQVLVHELIPEILVELFEDSYHPVTKTMDYKARRWQYHLIEEMIFESVKECVHESLNDYVDEIVHGSRTTMNSFELVCEDLVDEVVSKEIREVVKGMFSQTVDALLVAKQSEDIYQEMVNDVIDDMGVIKQSILETLMKLTFDEIMEKEVEEAVEASIRATLLAAGKPIMRSVKTPPESRLVSYMMDKTMDELILMMLLQNVSTQGVSFMITDMVDRMMEDHMMQVLLQEFTLLNQLDEKKRLNDAGRADHDESKNKGGSMIFLNHTRVGINLNGGIAVIPPIEVGVAVAEGATATTVGLAGDDREADINEGEDQDGLVLDASAKSNDGTLLSAIEISKSLISF